MDYRHKAIYIMIFLVGALLFVTSTDNIFPRYTISTENFNDFILYTVLYKKTEKENKWRQWVHRKNYVYSVSSYNYLISPAITAIIVWM